MSTGRVYKARDRKGSIRGSRDGSNVSIVDAKPNDKVLVVAEALTFPEPVTLEILKPEKSQPAISVICAGAGNETHFTKDVKSVDKTEADDTEVSEAECPVLDITREASPLGTYL